MNHAHGRRSPWILLFSALCLPAARPVLTFSGSGALPSTAAAWTADDEVRDALTFKDETPHGSILVVSSATAARGRVLAHATRIFPFSSATTTAGTIMGEYRTEGLSQYGALVNVRFLKAGARVADRDFYLAPSTAWRFFELPVRDLPEGAETAQLSIGLEAGAAGSLTATRVELTNADQMRLVNCGQFLPFVRSSAPQGLQNTVPFARLVPTAWGWWFASPTGHGFYSLGLESAAFDSSTRLTELGFNSRSATPDSPAWTTLAASDPKHAVSAFLSLDQSFGVSDIYSKQATTLARAYLEQTVAQTILSPWIVGSLVDGAFDFKGIGERMWTGAAGTEMLAQLRARYTTIEELDRAWGSTYKTYDELAAAKPDPRQASGIEATDLLRLARAYVDRYVMITARLFRAVDPAHLLFSPRVKIGPDLMAAIPYLDLFSAYDAVSVELHAANIHAGLDETEKEALDLVATKTGRPILVTHLTAPEGLTGRTLAEQIDQLLIGLYNLPYVVGAHWSTLNAASGKPSTEIENAVAMFNTKIWAPETPPKPALAAQPKPAPKMPGIPPRFYTVRRVPRGTLSAIQKVQK